MPRIIFKSRYLKNAAAHLSNMVKYVATREGVEKIPDSAKLLPATKKFEKSKGMYNLALLASLYC